MSRGFRLNELDRIIVRLRGLDEPYNIYKVLSVNSTSVELYSSLLKRKETIPLNGTRRGHLNGQWYEVKIVSCRSCPTGERSCEVAFTADSMSYDIEFDQLEAREAPCWAQ